ncbi:Uncharacterised protein [Yersinia enterocolitica]|nr:Uncharacterised protein [Yersinia mollaretii]CNK82113.1 Uncharacterised protein [Yersinia enterocolitica]CQQ91196.1 Uncharacterised protein [Yersinia mollaretii]
MWVILVIPVIPIRNDNEGAYKSVNIWVSQDDNKVNMRNSVPSNEDGPVTFSGHHLL